MPRATLDGVPGTPPLGLAAAVYGEVIAFGYGAPAGPEGGVPLSLDRPEYFLHFVVGRATEGIPAGARPARIAGWPGLLAPASPTGANVPGAYFGNHVRFLWRERGVRYVATLHTFGERATTRLLARLVQTLRPARQLRATSPGARIGAAAIPVPSGPAEVASAGGSTWVASVGSLAAADALSGRIVRIDHSTHARTVVAGIGDRSLRVAADAAGAWATSARIAPGGQMFTPLELTRIDNGGTVRARLSLGHQPSQEPGGVAIGAGAVWVATDRYGSGHGFVPRASGTIWKVDPTTSRVSARTAMPDGVSSLLATDHAIWAVGINGPRITRVDPATAAITGSISVGRRPYALAATNNALWVTNTTDGAVSRIDPANMRVTATIHVGRAPYGIAADRNGVWVALMGEGALARIDPNTNRVVERLAVASDPLALAADGRSLWVTLNSDATILAIPGH